MAKASELLSKLARTSRRNDLVSAIAQHILKRTKCDPNLLMLNLKMRIMTIQPSLPLHIPSPMEIMNLLSGSKTKILAKRLMMIFVLEGIKDLLQISLTTFAIERTPRRALREELDRRAAAILQPNKANPILTQYSD